MVRLTLALLLALSVPLAAQSQPPAQPDFAQMSKNFIEKFDANKDSKVSLEEFTKPGQEQFKGIDKNSDGSLTEDEAKSAIEEAMQARMEQMKQMQQMQPQQPPSQESPAPQSPAPQSPAQPPK